jgi:hypothetical protein
VKTIIGVNTDAGGADLRDHRGAPAPRGDHEPEGAEGARTGRRAVPREVSGRRYPDADSRRRRFGAPGSTLTVMKAGATQRGTDVIGSSASARAADFHSAGRLTGKSARPSSGRCHRGSGSIFIQPVHRTRARKPVIAPKPALIEIASRSRLRRALSAMSRAAAATTANKMPKPRSSSRTASTFPPAHGRAAAAVRAPARSARSCYRCPCRCRGIPVTLRRPGWRRVSSSPTCHRTRCPWLPCRAGSARPPRSGPARSSRPVRTGSRGWRRDSAGSAG